MRVYIKGKQFDLKPTQAIGKGGEADVFDIGNGVVAKIFKKPSHPDYKLLPSEQDGAKRRIEEHQKKLPAFPSNLPSKVVTPLDLVTDKGGGNILGYTMPFLSGTEPLYHYSERATRHGVNNKAVTEIFRDLHLTVERLHQTGVVVGDFNDLNILVKKTDAYLIDADSFQFGGFLCRMFTTRFVDPTHCKKDELLLNRAHSPDSDWYAFSVMLMQCLLFVNPYGGIYQPKDRNNKIPHGKRPLQRITVFNPEVRYPKPAVPYKVLPDDLLHYLQQVFEKDFRGIFPTNLLETLEWRSCDNCGVEHARHICPDCATAASGLVTQKITMRGNVTATVIFTTTGHIVHSTNQNNALHWVYHENNTYYRKTEGNAEYQLTKGPLDTRIRYRICNRQTLMAKQDHLIIMGPDKPVSITVDCYKRLPMFDSNESHYYWLQGGQLHKDNKFSPDYIGDVLLGQTLFWVGPVFGFGYYRAGDYTNAFVFDKERRGVTDLVSVPVVQGQLLDATTYFSKRYAWFCTTSQHLGKTYNTCTVLDEQGRILTTTQAEKDDGTWLGSIRGKFATGNQLYSPTNDGIVRNQLDGTNFSVKEFPDTEPFVDAECKLHPGNGGLFVVSKQKITQLRIA